MNKDTIVFDDILKIYNDEIRKRVKNKKRINEFEKYKITYLTNIYNTLKENTYAPHKYNIFLIRYPKYRIIMSQSIYDKIINHFVSKYILEPKLTKYLDIRNTATRKNMGSSYAINLLNKYIEINKRKYTNFYILKIDLSKYFYSIDHQVLKQLLKDKLNDYEYHLIEVMIDSTNHNYVNDTIIKLKEKELEKYPHKAKEINKLPLYEQGKGLAIGMMTNQILAIFYLYKLHNYIIHKLHLKYMVVYMDDYVIIHHDKEYLKYCLSKIKDILNTEYKLQINENKTKITSSKEGFIFLQYKYKIVNDKTIIKLRRSSLNNIKNNIKNNNKQYQEGKITYNKFFSSINNYANSNKYDKIKVSRIIDKYLG